MDSVVPTSVNRPPFQIVTWTVSFKAVSYVAVTLDPFPVWLTTSYQAVTSPVTSQNIFLLAFPSISSGILLLQRWVTASLGLPSPSQYKSLSLGSPHSSSFYFDITGLVLTWSSFFILITCFKASNAPGWQSHPSAVSLVLLTCLQSNERSDFSYTFTHRTDAPSLTFVRGQHLTRNPLPDLSLIKLYPSFKLSSNPTGSMKLPQTFLPMRISLSESLLSMFSPDIVCAFKLAFLFY